jgi:hypothetical protein
MHCQKNNVDFVTKKAFWEQKAAELGIQKQL